MDPTATVPISKSKSTNALSKITRSFQKLADTIMRRDSNNSSQTDLQMPRPIHTLSLPLPNTATSSTDNIPAIYTRRRSTTLPTSLVGLDSTTTLSPVSPINIDKELAKLATYDVDKFDDKKAKKILGIDESAPEGSIEGVDFAVQAPKRKDPNKMLGHKDLPPVDAPTVRKTLTKNAAGQWVFIPTPVETTLTSNQRSETFTPSISTASLVNNKEARSLKRRSISTPNLGDLKEMTSLANSQEKNILSASGSTARKWNLAGVDGSDNSNVWGGDKKHDAVDPLW